MQALPQTLANRLIQASVATPQEIIGCSDQELAQLEARFETTLPASYKHFLRTMGKAAGRFELDAMWCYDALPLAKLRAQAILDQNQNAFAEYTAQTGESAINFDLPADAFVFLAGTVDFIFFQTAAGEDPPVHLFQLGDRVPSNSLPSFSEWVRNAIEEYTPVS